MEEGLGGLPWLARVKLKMQECFSHLREDFCPSSTIGVDGQPPTPSSSCCLQRLPRRSGPQSPIPAQSYFGERDELKPLLHHQRPLTPEGEWGPIAREVRESGLLSSDPLSPPPTGAEDVVIDIRKSKGLRFRRPRLAESKVGPVNRNVQRHVFQKMEPKSWNHMIYNPSRGWKEECQALHAIMTKYGRCSAEDPVHILLLGPSKSGKSTIQNLWSTLLAHRNWGIEAWTETPPRGRRTLTMETKQLEFTESSISACQPQVSIRRQEIPKLCVTKIDWKQYSPIQAVAIVIPLHFVCREYYDAQFWSDFLVLKDSLKLQGYSPIILASFLDLVLPSLHVSLVDLYKQVDVQDCLLLLSEYAQVSLRDIFPIKGYLHERQRDYVLEALGMPALAELVKRGILYKDHRFYVQPLPSSTSSPPFPPLPPPSISIGPCGVVGEEDAGLDRIAGSDEQKGCHDDDDDDDGTEKNGPGQHCGECHPIKEDREEVEQQIEGSCRDLAISSPQESSDSPGAGDQWESL